MYMDPIEEYELREFELKVHRQLEQFIEAKAPLGHYFMRIQMPIWLSGAIDGIFFLHLSSNFFSEEATDAYNALHEEFNQMYVRNRDFTEIDITGATPDNENE